MKIIWMRHGSIRGPKEQHRYIGQADRAMTPQGAALLQNALKTFRDLEGSVDQIWCSDIRRCLESARIAGQIFGRSFQSDCRLREINLGTWEGRTFEEIREQYPDEYRLRGECPAHYHTPGGESFAQVQLRAVQFAEERVQYSREEDTILVLTHAGVIRSLCCWWDGRDLNQIWLYQIPYAASVVWEADKAELLRRLA